MKSLFLALLFCVISQGAHGLLTLTIDAADKTFYWSGSANDMEVDNLDKMEDYTFAISIGPFLGNESTFDIVNGLNVGYTGFGGFGELEIYDDGSLLVNEVDYTLYTTIMQLSGTPLFGFGSGTLSVSGNPNVTGSYASASQYRQQFMEGLDNVALYLLQIEGPADGDTTEITQAGTISVINVPEPTTVALGLSLLAGTACLLRRKRR